MLKDIDKLLYNLVSIDSTNPDYSKHAAGEEEIGNYIYDYFIKNNIDCIKQNVIGKRNNIIAMFEGNEERILLCSHLDTVYFNKNKIISPTIKEGKMYGLGSADAKASLAAMIQVLIEIKKSNKRNIPTIYFAAVISEESLHLGIKKLVEKYNKFDLAIIGEPTKLNIGIAHKGCLRFKIKTIGKSGHGSEPEKGINSIIFMAKFIEKFNKGIIDKYKEKKHVLLGKPTINIGKIEGGNAFNVIPQECVIEIDRRVIPNEKPSEILDDFRNLASIFMRKNKSIDIKVEKPIDYVPYLDTEKEQSIIKETYKVIQELNNKSQILGLPYSTDAGYLSSLKIPTIVFGPGDIEVCHSLDENVELSQVEIAKVLYINSIIRRNGIV